MVRGQHDAHTRVRAHTCWEAIAASNGSAAWFCDTAPSAASNGSGSAAVAGAAAAGENTSVDAANPGCPPWVACGAAGAAVDVALDAGAYIMVDEAKALGVLGTEAGAADT